MGGAGIEVVNEALLVAAGQEGRAGGAALRPAHVAAGAPHAVLRDAVDVRCGCLLRESLAAQLPVTEVVGDDDDDVGPALGREQRGDHKARGENEQPKRREYTEKFRQKDVRVLPPLTGRTTCSG